MESPTQATAHAKDPAGELAHQAGSAQTPVFFVPRKGRWDSPDLMRPASEGPAFHQAGSSIRPDSQTGEERHRFPSRSLATIAVPGLHKDTGAACGFPGSC